MNISDQITAFDEDIARLILRYRREFNLPYAAVIGVLHLRAGELVNEALNSEEESDEPEGDAV